MSGKSSILAILLLIYLCVTDAAAQGKVEGIYPDERNTRNAFTVSLLPIFARTFSISYARKLNNGNELIINPRFRSGSPKAADEPDMEQRDNTLLGSRVDDPQWFYDQFALRAGIRFPLGRIFGYEPHVQLGYGQFLNKVLVTKDLVGRTQDEYLRLDRKFNSIGIINMMSWVEDLGDVRIKWFFGVGVHLRNYRENQWDRYEGSQPVFFVPRSVEYSATKFSIHGGVEFGFTY